MRKAIVVVVVLAAAHLGGLAQAAPLSLRPLGAPPLAGPTQAKLQTLSSSKQNLVVATALDQRAVRLMRGVGATRLSSHLSLWLLQPNHSDVLKALSRADLLRYASADERLPHRFAGSPLDPPTDPLSQTQWWLWPIGAGSLTAPSPGVPISVIDAGVDWTHPEFASRPVQYLNPQTIDDPHGTMVASVAAAPVNGQGIVGVYPQATLRSIDHNAGYCSDTVQALELAINASAPSVFNMSWGWNDPRACPALYDEMIIALGVGHLPVASAGNDGQQGNPPNFPADFPHVLTVAATDQSNAVAYFSSQSPAVDIAAPGVSITAASPLFFDPAGYKAVDGTSFSSPMVAAAAAWVWTLQPTLRASQVMDVLRNSAKDVGAPGWDVGTGWGLLNIPQALNQAAPSADPQEPNDDINQVRAGGLFRNSAPPITSPGRGRASVHATVDSYEDPVDVYRVWIPARSVVSTALTPNDNVDLEFFRPDASTVYYRDRRAARRGSLIGGSYRGARRTDRFSVINTGRRGAFIFLEAFKALGNYSDAQYLLKLSTQRIRQ